MTVIAGTVTAVICVIVTTLILVEARGSETDSARGEATAAALRLSYTLRRGSVPGRIDGIPGVMLQVMDERRRVIAGTPGRVPARRPLAGFVPSETRVYSTRKVCSPVRRHRCLWVIGFRVFKPGGDWLIYAAVPIVPWYVSPGLLMFLASVSLLVILLGCLRAWATVDQTLAPVDAIRAELAEITAHRSGRRVTVPESRDEIRRLAEAANATLDRLDGALERQRSFTSDASHDLRSPIAAARAQIEEALLFPDDVDWPRTARSVLQSLERLQAIVTDLLQLARLDAAAWQEVETIDLAALVTIEVARSDRTKRIVPHLQESVTVRGDRLRLVRLLTNLLDNAERHAESRVDITVSREGDTAVLEVVDDGAGVPERDRDLVFQRFARLEDSRARDPGGTGLGLPIAREIAELHGGRLTIEDSERGARFVLRIPRNHDGRPVD
ncbi:signal transduction histidine kinase [Actinomadura luteofluorescens]|uniref:histidine kinase n=1 Tax=Actinomadura luteofluorescens TaxID=46163 RepID=A0A7Y9EHA5_9ACTN|nr:HAMP domain-containing sensor histidine kinase [Actinomadura luteofluorescens]NYD47592.1 signal transduction histidine kinase [Actinomadura luteofluorescens]